MKNNEPYISSLIGAVRHEAKKNLSVDSINYESIKKIFSELLENALVLDKENIEMLYVMMLVLNSFLKEKRHEKG